MKLFFLSFITISLVGAFPLIVKASTGNVVEYQSGQDTVRAYLALPAHDRPAPAIIIFHEWWGLNDWIKQKADALADSGFVAIAVDLYRGKTASTPAEAQILRADIPNDRAVRDMNAVAKYLNSRPEVIPGRLASVGWAMGGGYALTMALTNPDLDACIVVYGRVINQKDSIEKIACPILGIFGEDDRRIPAMSVKAFERAAVNAGKSVDIVVYPGVGADFMNENNPRSYNPNAARDAWDRIQSFLIHTIF